MEKIRKIMGYMESRFENYCQLNLVPIEASAYRRIVHTQHDNVAIVIQGPLKLEDDFTLETVKLYHSWYPNTKIIVSTWKNEDPDTINKLEEYGADIVLSDLPEDTGIHNVNCQLRSSREGIYRAKQLGSEYILKTRTDQRLTNHGFLDILTYFLHLYPSQYPEYQKGRIISFFANPHIVGFVADFLFFGYAEDISNLLCIPEQSISPEEEMESNHAVQILDSSLGDYTFQNMLLNLDIFDNEEYQKLSDSCVFPEVYIAKYYMQNVLNTSTTIPSYYEVLQKAFVLVDMKFLGFYWRKGDFASFSWLNKGLFFDMRYDIMYSDWLELYLTHQFENAVE